MSEDVKPYEAAPRASPTPDELRDLIRELGMTQRAAARSLDVDDRTLRYWASGQIPVPRMAILALRYLVREELDRVNRLADLQTQRESEPEPITDRDVLDLLGEAAEAGDLVQCALCDLALNGVVHAQTLRALDAHDRERLHGVTREEARARCERAILAARVAR